MRTLLLVGTVLCSVGCAEIAATTTSTITTTAAAPISAPPGDGEIMMPDVRGLTKDEALAKLRSAGKVGDIDFDGGGWVGGECDAVGANRATSSSPGAGQMVGRNSPASVNMCGEKR